MTIPGPFTMSQQAQNDYYPSLADAAFAYAEAVNAEIKDLFDEGADIVQIDEPYMQARPKAAEDYGLEALNRALEGVKGVTAVHICFGYAAIIHERPSAYSFLPQLRSCRCRQISIETAQSNLDCAVLEELPDQKIVLGVLDHFDARNRDAGNRRCANPPRASLPQAGGRDRRARLRPQIPAARGGLWEDESDGRRSAGREGRIG
jgi:5-methyltetrahydropteroyltriglutamate--homocysteine methyltransferase